MTSLHELTALDAVRLLCNAIQKLQHLDKTGIGKSPCCRDHGELILQAALEYLAWGDTQGTRDLMETYDEWVKTGKAPWPWDSSKSPPG